MTGMLAWTTVPAPVSAPQPLESLLLGVTEVGVALVCFGAGADARRRLAEAARRLDAEPVRGETHTAPAAAELADYLAGRRRTFDLPLDWRLTAGDQHVVLNTLYESVGYGETTTYGELAVRSGAYRTEHRGQAARRVGSIMGSNPIPVIVPCHRVLAAGGKLGGFSAVGGVSTKQRLLEIERARASWQLPLISG
jgi:methylated-DNA-[protein]-cysteine S-methyltransferase